MVGGGYGPFGADNGGLQERAKAIILPAIYCIIVRWNFLPPLPLEMENQRHSNDLRFGFWLPRCLAERNKTIERQFSNAGTNFLTRDNLISLAERMMMMIFGRQFDFIG